MRVLEITNNDSGDPWVWLIREHPSGEPIGMVLVSGSKFLATNSDARKQYKDRKLRQAVIGLHQSLGEEVEVRISTDLTRSGVLGDELIAQVLID